MSKMYRIKFANEHQSYLFRIGAEVNRKDDFTWEQFCEWLKNQVIKSGPLEWIVEEG